MKCSQYTCISTLTSEPKSSVKPLVELQKAATGAIAAATIASSVLSWAPPPADAMAAFSSSQVVAEKVIREGVYGEYEVDLPDQQYDDARSTFKSAKETKTKKGTLSIGKLQYNNLKLGAVMATLKQTATGLSFGGKLKSHLIPALSTEFSGHSNLFRTNDYETNVHFEISYPEDAPEIKLERFFIPQFWDWVIQKHPIPLAKLRLVLGYIC